MACACPTLPPPPPLLTPPFPGVSVGRPRLQRSSSQAGRPPPPARREEGPGPREELEPGSNSSTPRGSLEFLPPPPPHLLCSDEEEAGQVPGQEEQHQLSVADSVRKLSLQQAGLAARGPSPGSLRRHHSLSSSSNMPDQCSKP